MDVDISDMGFSALFAATSSKRIDLAISTITITPERLKSQSFTQGFYDSDGALATRADAKIKSLADCKGATIGVLMMLFLLGVMVFYIRQLFRIGDAE